MRTKPGKRFAWPLLPVIFSLAWPTMLEELLQTAVQYMDTAMVGVLGTQATAAVGSTTTVNWLIGSSISALGVGFLSYIAQAYGAGDRERAQKAVCQTVFVTLICGLLFTAATLGLSRQIPRWMRVEPEIQKLASQYFFILYLSMLPRTATILFGTVLRAVGDTKTPMRVGLLTNFVNVLGNYFLIYPTRQTAFGWIMPGAGLGIRGAAIASAVSFTIGGICITAALWHHSEISPGGHSLRPDWEILSPCLRIALPNMLQRFGTSLGYVVFASMINSLGEISTAAHTIANTVESAFYIPGYGLQSAAATLAGNALGARNQNKLHALTRILVLIETVLMIFSGGLLFVFAPQMLRLFAGEPEVISLGSVILRMVAVSEPLYGVSIVLEGLMQGVGDTVTPFVCSISGMWGIRIFGTFVCIRLLGMGLVSAWACMIVHNILLFFLFLFLFLRKNPLDRAYDS